MEQVFIQRVIPDTDCIFVRSSSTGNRSVIIMSVTVSRSNCNNIVTDHLNNFCDFLSCIIHNSCRTHNDGEKFIIVVFYLTHQNYLTSLPSHQALSSALGEDLVKLDYYPFISKIFDYEFDDKGIFAIRRSPLCSSQLN